MQNWHRCHVVYQTSSWKNRMMVVKQQLKGFNVLWPSCSVGNIRLKPWPETVNQKLWECKNWTFQAPVSHSCSVASQNFVPWIYWDVKQKIKFIFAGKLWMSWGISNWISKEPKPPNDPSPAQVLSSSHRVKYLRWDLTKYILRGPNICWGNQNLCPRGFDDNRQQAITSMMCQSYSWFIKPQNQAHDSDYYQWAMRLLPTLFTPSSWHNKQRLLMFPLSRGRIQDTPGWSLGSQAGNLHKTIRLVSTLHTSPDHTSSPGLTSRTGVSSSHSNATFPHSSPRS